MTAHRTTNRVYAGVAGTAAGRFARLLLCGSLILTGGVASAEELDVQLALTAVSEHSPATPPNLEVRTTWPLSCLPAVERTTLDGMHINIHLRAGLARCAAVPTPLAFKVNPVLDAGLSQMALGIYQVRIYLGRGDGSSELVAFRLLEAGRSPDARPESGFWWSVAGDGDVNVLTGSGITIEKQGNNIVVGLLSYDAGSPVWYFGSGNLSGPIAHIPLLRMNGGAEPFSGASGSQGADPGPVLDLSVSGPARAEAWLTRPLAGSSFTIETQHLEFMRLPFESAAATAWQGQWVLREADSRNIRLFDFSHSVTADAENIELGDPNPGASLKCRMADKSGHAMPLLCTLEAGTEGVLAEFDRIGLNRMEGYSPDGRPLEIVRLPR